MTTLEELGLLKMDFLGLRTLTVIRDAVSMIEKNHEKKIDIDNIDMNDPEIFKMISDGDTAGAVSYTHLCEFRLARAELYISCK